MLTGIGHREESWPETAMLMLLIERGRAPVNHPIGCVAERSVERSPGWSLGERKGL